MCLTCEFITIRLICKALTQENLNLVHADNNFKAYRGVARLYHVEAHQKQTENSKVSDLVTFLFR